MHLSYKISYSLSYKPGIQSTDIYCLQFQLLIQNIVAVMIVSHLLHCNSLTAVWILRNATSAILMMARKMYIIHIHVYTYRENELGNHPILRHAC